MGASIQSNVHSGQASTRASIQNEGDRPAVAQPLPRRTRRLPHLRGRNEAQTCFACSLPQRQPVRHGDLTQRPPLASGMRPTARTSYTPSERRRRRTRQSSESAASPFLSCSANAQGRRLMKRTREALHACNLWQTKETKKATEIRTKEEEDATDRPPAGRNLLYYSLVEHWRGTYSRNTTHTTPASRPAFHVDGRLVLTPLCA